ncbi:hypothetical protein Tco_0393740, partial [Tanacetum coccineum]
TGSEVDAENTGSVVDGKVNVDTDGDGIGYVCDGFCEDIVSLKNKDHVVKPKGTAPVQHSKLNANSDLKCVKCTSEVTNNAVKQVGPRKSSTNSKEEEFLTKLQNLKTQEKEAYSTGILEDTTEILAFRRELDELAQKYLREVPKNKATSTNSVNSDSGQDNTQPADQDDLDMPELIIFNTPQKEFLIRLLMMTRIWS